MDNKQLVFSFDIGIGSTGVAISDGNHLIYDGTHVFEQAAEAKDARLVRSARRNLARKKWRKQQIKRLY